MHDTEKFLFSSFPRTLSRLKQRSAVFTNLLKPYLPSTWHLEGAVWRNKKENRRPLNYKTSFARSRTPVGRRAASERVRAHCSCGKPLAQKDNKTRQKRRAESFKSSNAKFRFKRCTLDVCVAFQCVVNEINNKIEAVLSKELHRTFAMNLELLREYSFCAPVQRIISFLTFGFFGNCCCLHCGYKRVVSCQTVQIVKTVFQLYIYIAWCLVQGKLGSQRNIISLVIWPIGLILFLTLSWPAEIQIDQNSPFSSSLWMET